MGKKSLIWIIFFLLMLTGCSSMPTAVEQKLKDPSFKDVSVHDPSIIKDGESYYIFGSHLQFAKSNDLIHWEQLSNNVPTNSLIPNVFDELSEAFEFAKTDTLWAGDMIKLKDDKYYMYYSACEGSSPLSVMGLAVSDQVEGPYKNNGIFLQSGTVKEDGTAYDATKEPNVIDPDIFYDKNGKLWMVYGSYSGGIFILEMDEDTGLPIEGQGYGKKLLGGNHSRIEGPFIQYNEDTGYYYLFLSFGGLTADGGYNIRVARSKNPDGPYVDNLGQNMLDAKGIDGTVFDDDTISKFGTKLIGNFSWDNDLEFTNAGYVSPGHNSTYYDENLKRYFILFHTRFPNLGEEHSVRVHQMFFNEDGWPLIAPLRYANESVEKYTKDQVMGEYKVIFHGREITDEIKVPTTIQLKKNGDIKGDIAGSWKSTKEYFANVIINDTSYKGLFISQWDEYQEAQTMAFTGLSDEGETVFLVRNVEE
ncbi:MAG TPA: glycoside hydrolase family 43 protein [Niallia sp.]|nr:glycoside hydrolase family 43 protein [Niallia sp.]